MKTFKGTESKWLYCPPTNRFDPCTVAENGKIIGFSTKNSDEDMANEKLRANAPKLLEALQELVKLDILINGDNSHILNNAYTAINEAL